MPISKIQCCYLPANTHFHRTHIAFLLLISLNTWNDWDDAEIIHSCWTFLCLNFAYISMGTNFGGTFKNHNTSFRKNQVPHFESCRFIVCPFVVGISQSIQTLKIKNWDLVLKMIQTDPEFTVLMFAKV